MKINNYNVFRKYDINLSNDIIKRNFLIYSDENGEVKVNAILLNNDLWLTQELIGELFGKARNTITGHIKNIFDEDYFKELLERIRSIRTSERRIWQQITDVFAECSIYKIQN